jgi:hypothetical protein
MKRTILISNLLLAMVLIFASCKKDEDITPTNNGSGGEGGNESGILWGINDTADEIVNGIHLILKYDAASSSFIGTLENINTTTSPSVRVEVHVYDANNNSNEFGPTPAADMIPGETRAVTLPITPGTDFIKFNMHPEVG